MSKRIPGEQQAEQERKRANDLKNAAYWDDAVRRAHEKIKTDPDNVLWHKHHAVVWAAEEIARLTARVEELEEPGFVGFVDAAKRWLEHYPADIFTGVSGDAGPLFVVAIRQAMKQLDEHVPIDVDG